MSLRVCDWILCGSTAVIHEDGWDFCREHIVAHRTDEDLTHLFQPSVNDTRKQCGTTAGYSMHQSHDEVPCAPCKEAHRQDNRRYRRRSDRQLQECGTYGGYRRHKNHDTAVCDPCQEAAREYGRQQRARLRRSA